MDVSSKKSLCVTNLMLPAIKRKPFSRNLWQPVFETSAQSQDCLGRLDGALLLPQSRRCRGIAGLIEPLPGQFLEFNGDPIPW